MPVKCHPNGIFAVDLVTCHGQSIQYRGTGAVDASREEHGESGRKHGTGLHRGDLWKRAAQKVCKACQQGIAHWMNAIVPHQERSHLLSMIFKQRKTLRDHDLLIDLDIVRNMENNIERQTSRQFLHTEGRLANVARETRSATGSFSISDGCGLKNAARSRIMSAGRRSAGVLVSVMV
ncbi:hypothetical protein PENSPDRAFT_739680 [Peniophora sp. CONT]|nr:hypothetical protein PENSPDRAFT_739680 [Peniophora sp. CONT]